MAEKKPLKFGFFSNFFFALFNFKSTYRKFALQTLESEIDLISIINENRNLKNAVRVLLTEN
jgi:hypothetical protein